MNKFSELTPAGKRVRVAKDVLEWLDTKKIKAKPGEYLSVFESAEARANHADSIDTKTINGYVCEACALGAIFACAVERKPALNRSDALCAVSSRMMRFRLSPIFEHAQLVLIEAAFEQRAMEDSHNTPSKDVDAAVEFSKSNNPKIRMKRIMQNIIDNRGAFIP